MRNSIFILICDFLVASLLFLTADFVPQNNRGYESIPGPANALSMSPLLPALSNSEDFGSQKEEDLLRKIQEMEDKAKSLVPKMELEQALASLSAQVLEIRNLKEDRDRQQAKSNTPPASFPEVASAANYPQIILNIIVGFL